MDKCEVTLNDLHRAMGAVLSHAHTLHSEIKLARSFGFEEEAAIRQVLIDSIAILGFSLFERGVISRETVEDIWREYDVDYLITFLAAMEKEVDAKFTFPKAAPTKE